MNDNMKFDEHERMQLNNDHYKCEFKNVKFHAHERTHVNDSSIKCEFQKM